MTSTEHIRAEVLRLIEIHEPDKTDSVDILMKKWKGKENDLLKTLCEKYKEKFKRMQPIKVKDYYSIGSKIGTGNYYVLRRCKRKSDGGLVAIKIITKKNLETEDLQGIDNEINMLRQLTHPNIGNLHDIYESRTKICLVLDCCDGGELFDHVIDRGHFAEKQAKKTFAQACTALQYMHSKHIVHRDIRPENILFETKEKISSIKISNFDFADCCKHELLNQPVGTPNYVAPEILRKIPYDTQVDMWSIGVVLYIILCGFPPFYDENDDLGRLYSKIKNADYDMPSPYWDNISKFAKDLVRKLLEPNPNKRLTAKNALTHRWIVDKKLAILIRGYIRNEKKYEVLLTFSAEIIHNFAFLLFVGYFCENEYVD